MSQSSKQSPSPTKASTARGRGRGRLLFILIVILITPFLVELALRLPGLGPKSYHPRRFEPDGGVPFVPFSKGEFNQMVYLPNSVFYSVYDPAGDTRGYFSSDGRITYRLNILGMRSPDVPAAKPANGFRVLCLGDSITFGEGVREDDTFALRLQRILGTRMLDKQVTVINAGVQGYGTVEAVNFYYLAGRAYQPDVVLLGFYLNDATDFGETIRQNDARHKPLELFGLARYSKIAETYERRRIARQQQEEFFRTTRESFRSKRWEECKDSLLRLRGDTMNANTRLLVVIWPVLWDLSHYPLEDIHQLVRDELKKISCETLDLLDVFRGMDAESLWVHPTDQHPNEIAHRLAADRIAEALLRTTP